MLPNYNSFISQQNLLAHLTHLIPAFAHAFAGNFIAIKSILFARSRVCTAFFPSSSLAKSMASHSLLQASLQVLIRQRKIQTECWELEYLKLQLLQCCSLMVGSISASVTMEHKNTLWQCARSRILDCRLFMRNAIPTLLTLQCSPRFRLFKWFSRIELWKS